MPRRTRSGIPWTSYVKSLRYSSAIAHVCGFFIADCSAYWCGREDPVVVSLFHSLKAMYGLMLKMTNHLVLWSLGWCFPGYLFVGGLVCLCCAADLSTGMGTSVFHDWVTCNNCTWVYPVLLWLVYRPGIDGSCQRLGGPVFA